MPDRPSTKKTSNRISNTRTPRKRKPKTISASLAKSLGEKECWAPADLSTLPFKTTDELENIEGVIEQDRAVQALELGLGIDRKNYNIYIAGASGTGKRTQLRLMLNRVAPQKPVPLDWIYVHNFKDADAPVAISLTPGEGKKFKKALEEFLEKLQHDIPKAFHSKEHQKKINQILTKSALRESKSFEDLHKNVSKVGFAVRSTKKGLEVIPVVNDRMLSRKNLQALSSQEKKKIERQRSKLEPLISDFLERARNIELETEKKLQDVQRELGILSAKKDIEALKEAFPSGGEKLVSYLDGLFENLLGNLGNFLPEVEDQNEEEENDTPLPSFVEFHVNVVVDNSETKGAPVIIETHPSFYRLFGKIERRVKQGIWFTDHRMIRAGSVEKANGGYLVVHIKDLFQFPGVWENLKATLRNREGRVEDFGENVGILPTSGLKPEPIPVDLKLILIGSNRMYHLLYELDDDFQKIFQVKSDFDYEIHRDQESTNNFARFIATSLRNSKLLVADRSAVSAVIEHSSREVESQEKLTLRFNEVSNLLTEADFHARENKAKLISRKHVERAILEREKRSSLVADKMYEELQKGLILIDTKGSRVGVINGLAVYQIGEYQFGRPTRITARCYLGKGSIINIERQSELSGSSHDKGVLILAGLLGGLFAQKHPLGLTASIAFEQSYGPIDGDSASCAELYAILSSIAEIPIHQGIAITGSLNQLGEVQPIGGINFKVEGFFRLCRDRGLDGTQGVIIPVQNVRHLMLSREVRDAVKAKKFSIWPIERIEQGIELFSGIPAGSLEKNGEYTKDSFFYRVAKRLKDLEEYRMSKGLAHFLPNGARE